MLFVKRIIKFVLFLMKWQAFFLHFTLFGSALTAGLENNACTNIEAYRIAAISDKCSHNPDVSSNMASIIDRHGYKMSKHSVTTNDGYILNLFQIWSPNVKVSKYPIFVLHGIAINVEPWVSTGNTSLAFNLVERNYDVWVGTIRGTVNANKHQNLTINDPEYWNYNLDTLAKEDYSTQVNFVANATQQKVLVIAHSMGTTLSFMYTSEYSKNANQLIKGVVALAPVAYLNGIASMELIRPFGLALIDLLNAINVKGLLYHEEIVHHVEISLCKIVPEICFIILSTIPGKSVQAIPKNLLLFLSYWPGGMSIFELKQYLQIAGSKRFQKFDYGSAKNQDIYGNTTPSVYDLSKIEVPFYLFYGKNDIFYEKENIERLYQEIGSSNKFKTKVPVNQDPKYDFAHLDFLDSQHIEEFFYKDLFAKIESNFG